VRCAGGSGGAGSRLAGAAVAGGHADADVMGVVTCCGADGDQTSLALSAARDAADVALRDGADTGRVVATGGDDPDRQGAPRARGCAGRVPGMSSDRRHPVARLAYPAVTVLWVVIAVGETLRGHPRAAIIFALIALVWVAASLIVVLRPRG
jgi:hypothetical protein